MIDTKILGIYCKLSYIISMPKKLSALEEKINITFKSKDLLRTALTHRSYLNENPQESREHNERLEFLGDAVLELVVTEYLYKNYKNPEGDLTSWRAALVNTQTMAEVAGALGLNTFLYLSKGEAKDTGKARQAILANTMEALIGAVYLDRGYKTAQMLIKNHIISRLPEILEKGLWRDSKSFFQEMAQEKEGITPTYKVLSEEGPDHDRVFRIGVYIGEDLVGEGEGSSKQEAEQAAATDALKAKNWE